MNCLARLNAARLAFHQAEMLVSEDQLQLGLHEVAFERFARAEIRLGELLEQATDDADTPPMLAWAAELEAALEQYQKMTTFLQEIAR